MKITDGQILLHMGTLSSSIWIAVSKPRTSDIIYTIPTPRTRHMSITTPELKEMQREAVIGLLQDSIAGSGQKLLEETRKRLSSECRNQREMQVEFCNK